MIAPANGVKRQASRRKAKHDVIDWLTWYHRMRLRSTLAYLSPMKIEQDWLANQPRHGNS